MAEMNVSMSLTLADAASGPLRAFAEGLAQLKTSAQGVSANLEKIAAGIGSIGKAAAGAASVDAFSASLSALAPAMAKVRAEGAATASALGNIGSRASAGVRGTYALEQAMAALGGTLSRSIEKLTATAAGLGMIGTEARAAGAGVAAGARAMNSLMIPSLGEAEGKASSLMTVLKGLAEIYAAMEIKKGLKASVGDAAELQSAEIMLKGLNLGAERTQEILGKAWDDSRALKFISVLDAVKLRMAAIGGLAQTMDDRVIDATLPQATKLANNLRAGGDKTPIEDMVRNAYGFIEARGQSGDPEAINRSFDILQRWSTTSGGKITMRDAEMFLRQFGQGASQISDDGLYHILGALDQSKISGGEGGGGGGASRLATAMKMLEAYGMGKKMSTRGTAMFEDAGIMDANGQMNNAKLLASSPMEWIESLLPMILAYVRKYSKTYYQGADVNDPKATAVAIQKFLTSTGVSVTAQQAEGLGLQTDTRERIARQAAQAKNAKGVDGTAEDVDKTWTQVLSKASAALTRLGVIIGDQLLKVLGPVVDGFTSLFNLMSDFFDKHPIAAAIATWTAAILGVTLAVTGFMAVFGVAVSAIVAAIGPAALLSIGVRTLAGTIAFLGDVARLAMGPWGALAAAFAAGFAFGDLLANLEVGGKSVSDWVSDWMGSMIETMDRGWNKMASMVPAWMGGSGQLVLTNEQKIEQMSKPMSRADIAASASWNDAPKGSPFGAIDFGKGSDWDIAKAGGQADPHADHPKKGRFAHYDDELEQLKESYRLAEDADKRFAETQKRDLAANLITVKAFYDEKLAMLQASVAAEITIKKAEKARLSIPGEDGKVDQAAIRRVDADITILGRSLDSGTHDIELERKAAMLKLDKEAAQVQRDLMKASGDRHAAELDALQKESAAKDAVLVKNGVISAEEAKAHAVQFKAAQDYQEQSQQIAVIQEAYAEKLAAIDDQERNGTLPALLAEQQKLDLRKQEAAQLDDLIAKLRAYAVASGNEGAVLTLDKLGTKNKSTKGQLDPSTVTMLKATQSGFEQMFSSVLNGSMSAGKAIEQFAQNLKKSFLDIISKKLGDELFKSLFGGDSASGGGIGGLFGMIGGLFSSGATVGLGSGSLVGAVGGGDYNALGDVSHLAVGTDYVPRDMLAMIHKGERVMPAKDNAAFTAAAQMRGSYSGPQTIMLQAHPDIMNMRFQDVLDAHVNHAMATR